MEAADTGLADRWDPKHSDTAQSCPAARERRGFGAVGQFERLGLPESQFATSIAVQDLLKHP